MHLMNALLLANNWCFRY